MSNVKPYIIGITGGSASGKTFFLSQLRDSFAPEQLCIVSQDDYYFPIEKQLKDKNNEVNFDHPGAIDRETFSTDLQKLKNGEKVERLEYVFNNPDRKPVLKEFSPSTIILIEGLFIFYYEEIFELIDLKVFVDAREDIKLNRRLQRDEVERGIKPETVIYQWNNHVYPAYKKYLLPYRDDADIIITNNHSYQKGLELLKDHINKLVNGK